MELTTCPIATIRAPADLVWALLLDTAGYGRWADVEVVSAEPSGLAVPGQVVRARTRGLGRWWAVRFDVRDVMVAEHRFAVDVALPMGIVNREVITVHSVSPGETRVGFN
jgi:hypothetical protein